MSTRNPSNPVQDKTDQAASTVTNIEWAEPRPTVEIHLPDGRVLSGPRGAPVGEFMKKISSEPSPVTPQDDSPARPGLNGLGGISSQSTQESASQDYYGPSSPIVGAIINTQLRELTYPIEMESTVLPVTMDDADGMRIYRRSLTYLLELSFEELFPEAVLTIDHSVASGGYFCQIKGRPSLSTEELSAIEMRMHSMVMANLPIVRERIPLEQAIAYYQAKGHDDTVRLLAHRKKDYLTVYRLGDYMDYHHGYMVPSTSYLRWFSLLPTGEGFTLRFPRRHRPTELLPMPDYPKLLSTFRQYGDWLWRLGISNAGALNDAISEGRIQEIILVSEALQEQQIADITDRITERLNDVRLVLVAGPSASGKTTFSKRLTVQLLAHGISPFPLEMDNYFLDRDKTPLDEKGGYDFESLRAINRRQMALDLGRLIAGEAVQLPHYNFLTGLGEPGDLVQLEPGQIIILEGIHGLNPDLTPEIPPEQTFRVYVSALTQLNLDRHNRVSTTDTRLLRRIVRDSRERGYSALDTIRRWESVRRGEKRYIFPFQENADVMFNSALAYEISVLKPLAEPLLRQVPYGTPEYIEAKRLLAFIEWFLPLEPDLIPDNSILREFVGGSILRPFKLWHNHIG
jgi:uridine kinase